MSSSSLTSHACSTSSNLSAALRQNIVFSAEVAHALANQLPIVALESTIISHGMPYPQNYQTALAVEQEARQLGVTPATIAILKGKIHVGLDSNSLEELARMGHKCHKCSRRDLSHILATHAYGATTVAGTMYIASLVGIKLFVTGGIGGVHRGVEETMDISADLTELGRTPVTVVCAGVKSILDIGKTLEYLETQGVSVVAFGTKEFPAFFTAHSGFEAPLSLNTTQEVAKLISAQHLLQLQSGIVVAVPIPESDAAAAKPTEVATQQALKEAKEQNVQGREITPFLLQRINELTQGASLKSNIALIKNNVRVGSRIALDLAHIQHGTHQHAHHSITSPGMITPPTEASKQNTNTSANSTNNNSTQDLFESPVVVGGTNLDVLGRPTPGSKFLLGTSNPGTLTRCWGGVGRNVAECMARLQTRPYMITAIGSDEQGEAMLQHSASIGLRTDYVLTSDQFNTSTYMAILDEKGDLFTTIADMAVCDTITPDKIPASWIKNAPLVVLDGNVSQAVIEHVSQLAAEQSIPVVFEPTSIEKSVRCMSALLKGHVHFITPSAEETLAMAEALGFNQVKIGKNKDAYEHNHDPKLVRAQCEFILSKIHDSYLKAKSTSAQAGAVYRPVHIISKRGAYGVMIASWFPNNGNKFSIVDIPAGKLDFIVNTSGAGDTLVGAMNWSLLTQAATKCHQQGKSKQHVKSFIGYTVEEVVTAVGYGMRAAEMTLQSDKSVNPEIVPEVLLKKQQDYLNKQKQQIASKL